MTTEIGSNGLAAVGPIADERGSGCDALAKSEISNCPDAHLPQAHLAGPQVESAGQPKHVGDESTTYEMRLIALGAELVASQEQCDSARAVSPKSAQELGVILENRDERMTVLNERYQKCLLELLFLEAGGEMVDYHLWRKRKNPYRDTYLDLNPIESDTFEYNLPPEPVRTHGQSTTSSSTSSSAPAASGGQGKAPRGRAAEPRSKTGAVGRPRKDGDRSRASGGSGGERSRSRVRSPLGSPPRCPVRSPRSGSSSGVPSPVHQAAAATLSLLPPAPLLSASSSSAAYSQRWQESRELAAQEVAEQAKREADVRVRLDVLQKDGLWSSLRTSPCEEPPRPKCHWDFLLEEMEWLAGDFSKERRNRVAWARKIAKAVLRYHHEKATRQQRAVKENQAKLRRIASGAARDVRGFWGNIEKVLKFKYDRLREAHRKEALQEQLSAVVDKTEQYSSWLAEDLDTANNSNAEYDLDLTTEDGGDTGRLSSTFASEVDSDGSLLKRQSSGARGGGSSDVFCPGEETDADDEETILAATARADETEVADEVNELCRESEMPLDDFLEQYISLEYLEERERLVKEASDSTSGSSSSDDSGSSESESSGSSESESCDDDEGDGSEDGNDDEDGNDGSEGSSSAAVVDVASPLAARRSPRAVRTRRSARSLSSSRSGTESEASAAEPVGGDAGAGGRTASTVRSLLAGPLKGADGEFDPAEESDSSDDETTILKEEAQQDEAVVAAEVNELQRESEMPLDDFLQSIPTDYLEQRDAIAMDDAGSGSGLSSSDEDENSSSSASSSDESLSSSSGSGSEVDVSTRPALRRSVRSPRVAVATTTRRRSNVAAAAGDGGGGGADPAGAAVAAEEDEVDVNDMFDPDKCSETDEDDETTILREVHRQEKSEVDAEVNDLQRESEMPLEDFLDCIPEDYLKHREAMLALAPVSATPSSIGMSSSDVQSRGESSDSGHTSSHGEHDSTPGPAVTSPRADTNARHHPIAPPADADVRTTRRGVKRVRISCESASCSEVDSASNSSLPSRVPAAKQVKLMDGSISDAAATVTAVNGKTGYAELRKTSQPATVTSRKSSSATATTTDSSAPSVESSVTSPLSRTASKSDSATASGAPVAEADKSAPQTSASVASEADGAAGGTSLDSSGPDDQLAEAARVAEELQPTGFTLSTSKVDTDVPFLLKHTLREYQHIGLNWLATMHHRKLNGILADEMGLGKTIQTISLLAYCACQLHDWGPHLIVVPTSVLLNWEMELKKWCPAFKILTYYGSIKERKSKRVGWTKPNSFHVCITSYKLALQDHVMFRRKKWRYLILDEAQHIKNFKSQRWQTLLGLSSGHRLLLTGTPLQNSLMELWSLMHFLMPRVFASHQDFKEWFANPLTGMIEGTQEYNHSIVQRLHKVLRPFLLRRLKHDVEKQLPGKFEHIVPCWLSKRQRYLYDDFMSRRKTKETLAAGNFLSVINILMQLRKVCNHPDMFEPRPIVSPACFQGITYSTASLVLTPCIYRPLSTFNPSSHSFDLLAIEEDEDLLDQQRSAYLQVSQWLSDDDQIQAERELPSLQARLASDTSFSPMKRQRCEPRPDLPLAFVLAELADAQAALRRQRQLQMARLSRMRCQRSPLLGRSLRRLLESVSRQREWRLDEETDDTQRFVVGVVDSCVSRRPSTCYCPATALELAVRSNVERYEQLAYILRRYVMYVPLARSSAPVLHTVHPPPHIAIAAERGHRALRGFLSDRCDVFHGVVTSKAFSFPERRLIQYDCGKLQVLDILLKKLRVGAHRVLIFTQMTKMLDVLETFLTYHGHMYLRLDGSTGVEKRQVLMERFNSDPRIFCFILSTRSGGLGINLTGADTVVFYDSDWNPTMDAQAQDRCHRIGQTREVHIYRLISEHTIEENILKKANQKRLLGDVAIEDGGFTPAFFKQDSIVDMFKSNDACLEDIAAGTDKEKSSEDHLGDIAASLPANAKHFEECLSKVEDEMDAQAAKKATAEVAAEEVELNSNFVETKRSLVDDVMDEFAALAGQMSPLEQYALRFLQNRLQLPERPAKQKYPSVNGVHLPQITTAPAELQSPVASDVPDMTSTPAPANPPATPGLLEPPPAAAAAKTQQRSPSTDTPRAPKRALRQRS